MDLMQRLQTRLPAFPKFLGITFIEATAERLVAEMQVRPDMSNGNDTIHGGALMAFADTLGAVATIINLPDGKATATLESKTNFIAPAPVGTTLTGETVPLHRGRRTQVWETRISTADGRLVAKVTQTQMVL
ncbi:PaaI family thioesterase [Limobrevibacterium gyesilva]|uniref:PaaI family thioesterase n=1 Tax=Limobrevibacterium gyesilva TaxID=2991712 RepID=A0AA41YR07_9PROT|nr:PaaI family thioesterase [Limobrevibacterium gyesilva]MCW3473922.1 PaaI family thioesterase [Limobrevibacterium gyesilva]